MAIESSQFQGGPSDYSQYAQARPPKPNRRRLYIIIGAAVLGLIVIAVGIWFFWQREQARQMVVDQEQTMREVENEVERMAADCPEGVDEAACYAQAVLAQAELTGEAEVCEMLEGSAYDNCLWGAAKDKQSLDLCRAIKTEATRQNCLNGLRRQLAMDNLDTAYCDDISDGVLAESCRKQVENKVVIRGLCSEYGVEQVRCDDAAAYDKALSASDPTLCESITDEEMREDCLSEAQPTYTDEDGDGLSTEREEELGLDDENPDFDGDGLNDGAEVNTHQTLPDIPDSDEDGLTDGEEVNTYGTDPLNRDTDGDGFLDGEEVEAGYNPLGEGALE